MVETVHRITHKGVQTLVGQDAQDFMDKSMKSALNNGDSPYIFYNKGHDVYVVVDTSGTQALTFPQPKDYGITSPELYSMAKTYRNAVARLIEKRLKKPLTFLDQLKKAGAVAGPIIVLVALTFVLAIAAGG